MNVQTNFDLSKILWYKIGGTAQYLIEITDREDVLRALDFCQKHGVKKLFVIGYGSNLLFSDKFFDGAILRIVRQNNNLISLANIDSEVVVDSFAGESLDAVIQFSFSNNLVGLEWAGGLPGTVGAAVRGNVGAFGGEIKDKFFKAEVLNISASNIDIVQMEQKDLDFSYRNSAIKQNRNLIITGATFKLKKADAIELEKSKKIYLANIEYRNTQHPQEYPNCGSIFKNIVNPQYVEKITSVFPDVKPLVENKWHGKVSMGHLIKQLGFSGVKIGNAQVSEKHANFIINLGGAKFSDVTELIDKIKVKFTQTFGFTPETEVEIVTF